MPESRTITCEACGQQYSTKRKNTKYCRVCRVTKNLQYLKSQTHTCFVCGELYAPISRQKKEWLICLTCDGPWAKDTEGQCAICEQVTDQLIDPDIAVCRKCAQTPSKRGLLLRALLAKQKERMINSRSGVS